MAACRAVPESPSPTSPSARGEKKDLVDGAEAQTVQKHYHIADAKGDAALLIRMP